MAKVIVSTGRGGVGKSTFVALTARFLAPPTLLIDLDPDESLADMVGIDLEQSDTSTISELLYEAAPGPKGRVAPDTVLKDSLPSLLGDYRHVVIDSPAGLEHLNRKVVSSVNDLFIIVDPSDKSAKHVGRVRDIIGALDIRYDNLYIVANYRFTGGTESLIEGVDGTYLGKVDYDAELKRYNLEGRSLLELSDESAAALSVQRILRSAGYPAAAS